MLNRLPSFRCQIAHNPLASHSSNKFSPFKSFPSTGKLPLKNAFQTPFSLRTLIQMEKLPYNWEHGLTPFCSPKTLDIHYNNIYKKYVRASNFFIRDTRWEFTEHTDAIINMAKHRSDPELYENLSAAWNHIFFFNCMFPGGKAPSEQMKLLIKVQFGALENLATKMYEHARGMPAGGFVWVIEKNGYFDVQGTVLNGSPLCDFGDGHRILLGLDVWEHAYFADYHDGLEGYVNAFFSVINWEWVEMQLLSNPVEHPGDEGIVWEDSRHGQENVVTISDVVSKYMEKTPPHIYDQTSEEEIQLIEEIEKEVLKKKETMEEEPTKRSFEEIIMGKKDFETTPTNPEDSLFEDSKTLLDKLKEFEEEKIADKNA